MNGIFGGIFGGGRSPLDFPAGQLQLSNTSRSMASSAEYEQRLQAHLRSRKISSLRVLAEQAGVSRWQVQQLRQGKANQMRVEPLGKLAIALGLSLEEAIAQFSPSDSGTPPAQIFAPSPDLAAEYRRLQDQLAHQRTQLQLEFEQASLDRLESWLRQWPRIVHLARQRPELSAAQLDALLKQLLPLHQLLDAWDVQPIGTVDEAVAYEPQWHTLTQGQAAEGDRVRVQRPGYRHHDRLLFRAEVVPDGSP